MKAFDLTMEKDLQENLEKSRLVVLEARGKLGKGLAIAKELQDLAGIAEEVKASFLLLQERFRSQREDLAGLSSRHQERHSAMEESFRQAIEGYLSLIDTLSARKKDSDAGSERSQSLLDWIIPWRKSSPYGGTLDQLQSFLDKVLPKRSLPIYGSLPYRNLNYPAKQPERTPAIQPAYKGGNASVVPEDLKGTPEAPLSEEIVLQAQWLNWDPARIHDWVKNAIETEWYYGCMKGAEETLRQGSGNDCDQAALLVALLRASGFPSRYVRGVVEIGADELKNLTGVNEENMIAQFLQKSGIPFSPVIRGGKPGAFEIEHIWVESYIPFANFRGTVVDDHGKGWFALDTSIKVAGYEVTSPIDILREMSLSGVRDEYLGAVQSLTPLETIRAKINTQLAEQHPGTLYEGVLRIRTMVFEDLQVLPASLQYRESVVTGEYAAIPDTLIHKVRFIAADVSGKTLFDHTIETLKLSNRMTSLSYEPETVEDHEIANAFGGLDNTPPFLVNLRPGLMPLT
jgi:transglutaminase-like putative cysteine protease